MSKYKVWLLDFDYTIVDSSQAVYLCMNYALKNMGYPAVSYETATQCIGHTIKKIFANLTDNHDPAAAEEFRRLFRKKADELENEYTKLYSFVPEVLNAADQAGIRMGIVSTKNRFRIKRFLDNVNLTGAFEHIIGGEDVQKHKPEPEPLELAMEKFGVPKHESVYTGDSIVDVQAARAASIDFAAVLSGVTAKDVFEPFNPVEIAPDLSGITIIHPKQSRKLKD